MITNIEENETTTATSEQPKAGKKTTGAKPARNVAPAKAKSGKKASPAKKAPKAAKKAARPEKAAKEKGTVREGSKTETILALLKRPEGATAKVDLPPILRQTVKTQNPFKGELSHGANT